MYGCQVVTSLLSLLVISNPFTIPYHQADTRPTWFNDIFRSKVPLEFIPTDIDRETERIHRKTTAKKLKRSKSTIFPKRYTVLKKEVLNDIEWENKNELD